MSPLMLESLARQPSVRIRCAVYDSSVRSANGSHWQWHHSDLQKQLLDKLYYDVVSPQFNATANELVPDAIFTAIDDQWCCWYRVFNAGRDTIGRPGRFVIAAALMRRCEVVGADTTPVLELPFFREVAAAAENSASIPPPTGLEQTIDRVEPAIEPQALDCAAGGTIVPFKGTDAFHAAVVACGNVAPSSHWGLEVRKLMRGEDLEGFATVSFPQEPREAAHGSTERPADLSSPGSAQNVRNRRLRALLLVALAVLTVGAAATFSVHWMRTHRFKPEQDPLHRRFDARGNNKRQPRAGENSAGARKPARATDPAPPEARARD